MALGLDSRGQLGRLADGWRTAEVLGALRSLEDLVVFRHKGGFPGGPHLGVEVEEDAGWTT